VSATVNGALHAGISNLRAAGIYDAANDARRLMAHALGISRDRLTLALTEDISPEAVERFGIAIKDRAAHKPVAQIVGHREFYGRQFTVNGDVLDPRPETEILVNAALARPFERVLDMGTGTGCILLSLLAERPDARGLGVDISAPALNVARANCRSLGLESRAEFALSDWFSAVSGAFDLVVANPPYIAQDEMAALAEDVRLYEPKEALTPGPLGLEAYQRIAARLPHFLAENGRVFLETGPTQGRDVVALFEAAGLIFVTAHTDMDGRNRVVEMKKQPKYGVF